jgi:HPt (histidine-containing phosphotransfer) domain-containing protein
VSDQQPLLDQSVLDELRESVGGDDEFVADLIKTYVHESGDHFDAMQSAAAAGDADAIVRPAHTLKSSSAALGATLLAAVAREIETAGRTGETSGLSELVARAQAVWHETRIALESAGLVK